MFISIFMQLLRLVQPFLAGQTDGPAIGRYYKLYLFEGKGE
jgi:hypothetical protein